MTNPYAGMYCSCCGKAISNIYRQAAPDLCRCEWDGPYCKTHQRRIGTDLSKVPIIYDPLITAALMEEIENVPAEEVDAYLRAHGIDPELAARRIQQVAEDAGQRAALRIEVEQLQAENKRLRDTLQQISQRARAPEWEPESLHEALSEIELLATQEPAEGQRND